MQDLSDQDITSLLQAWNLGEEEALPQVVPLVYEQLRRLAAVYMARERPGHSLQTTALVHEAYLRLASGKGAQWRDRSHFYAVCASMMRRILVDRARARSAAKRGGHRQQVTLEDGLRPVHGADPDLLAVDEALQALAQLDPRKSKVVELRYFGGLSVKETAKVLRISPATVVRDWEFSKVWLLRTMRERDQG